MDNYTNTKTRLESLTKPDHL